MVTLKIVIFAFILHTIRGFSTPEDNSYVAAVVEFKWTEDTQQNLKNYIEFIERAAEQDADIIVFPELALMGHTGTVQVPFDPSSSKTVTPAENPLASDEILVKLSKAARDNQIYVLANVREIAYCGASTDCLPGETHKIFNTNVVFDRKGTIIDRYRKIHLFDKQKFNPGDDGHLGMFDTDFGVTFGHIICFDILYLNPLLELVQKYKIKNMLFPTMWVSNSPIFLGVNMQAAMADALNVNVACAGANNVTDYSAGSGIYSGKAGPLISIQPTSSLSRLLLAEVPKEPGKTEPRENWKIPTPDSHDLKILELPIFLAQNSKLLDSGFQKFELQGLQNLSCVFEANLEYQNTSLLDTHYYRAFAFIGFIIINGNELGIATCGVTSCSTTDVLSCTDIYSLTKDKETVLVKDLKITITSLKPEYDPLTGTDDVLYIPTSLKADKYFVPPSEYTTYQYSNEDNATCVYKLDVPQKDLFSFVIITQR